MAQPQLPLIDMGAYRSDMGQARAAVVAEIAASSRALGFFYIVNRGVSQSLLDDQLTWRMECVPTCMPPTGAPPSITFCDHIQEMIHRTYAPVGAPVDA